MSRMTIQTDIGRITDFDTFVKYTAQCIGQLNNIINGNLEFDVNIASQTVTYTFTSINTPVLITHGLKRKNLKFIVVDADGPGVLWHKASMDDESHIALASAAATVVTFKIMLF